MGVGQAAFFVGIGQAGAVACVGGECSCRKDLEEINDDHDVP